MEGKRSSKQGLKSCRKDFMVISDNRMLSFSLAISVLGLLFLFIFSGMLSPKTVALSEVQYLSEESYISFVGYLGQISMSGQYVRLDVCDLVSSDSCVSVVVLKADAPSWLVEGDFISVTGTVKEGVYGRYVSVHNEKDISPM